jgi:hypothetical protein
MELLEGQDPDKKRLIETSERHRRALEKQVNELGAKTEKMVTNALIIGGSLALTYVVVSSLSSGKKKKKKRRAKAAKAQVEAAGEVDEEVEESGSDSIVAPTIISMVGSRVINTLTFMLLDIAKEKLFDYLKARKQDDENS